MALTAPLSAAPRRRFGRRLCRAAAHGGVMLGRYSCAAATCSLGSCSAACALCVWPFARSLLLWGRSPSHDAQGAAACGAHGAAACCTTLALLALALLAPALLCRRTCGSLTLGRRASVAAARSLSAVRSARRLALSACGRWRGRFLSGGSRRRTALTAPLPLAPRWLFGRRLDRAAAHGGVTLSRYSSAATARSLDACSAACAPRGRPFARSLLLWGRSPSCDAQGAATCGAHGAAACCATLAHLTLALLAPALLCHRACGGVTLGRRSSVAAARSLSAVRSAQRLLISACGRWHGRFLSGGSRQRTALTAPLPAAPRRRSGRQLGSAATLAAG